MSLAQYVKQAKGDVVPALSTACTLQEEEEEGKEDDEEEISNFARLVRTGSQMSASF